ncbi:MAG: 1,4-alpha-glucan branching protein domain-containing protein [Treponemataceae bacterium]
MSKKSLIFHLVAHKGYFKHFDEKNISKNQILFNAISQTYLPLLNMFANLESDGIPFKIGMTISPTLCAQLSNPQLQQSYIEWLEKMVLLGEEEVARYPEGSEKNKLAKLYLKNAKRDKRDFIETFNQDILSKFAYYAKKGNIELFATSATYAFLPHISDYEEAVNAQIEIGLSSHKHFFGLAPEGFYLPHLGYTQGLEKNLRSYGLNYTILESQGILFANPCSEMGIFSPVRGKNSFAFFAKDTDLDDEISGKSGYKNNKTYRNQEKDIGFDSDLIDLSNFLDKSNSRCPTVFRYCSNGDDNSFYDVKKAKEQVMQDAKDFVNRKVKKLQEASTYSGEKHCSLLCSFSEDLLGENWFEGINWLEQVFRLAAENNEIDIENCCDITKEQYQLQEVQPAFSAENRVNFGENLLDNSNDWLIRYMRKSTERMIDLGIRFSEKSGLKVRALNLAAKEILLCQASDWANMIHNKFYPDYAKEQFIKTINGFSTVYESLGSNTISTEWLTNLEREHDLFPWTNYRVYSKKK